MHPSIVRRFTSLPPIVKPVFGHRAEAPVVSEFVEAATDGPAALLIEGEPGIGKTTLWLDGLEQARQRGARVLAARTSAVESVLAYATLADLLADVDPSSWQDLPAPQRRGLAVAMLTEDPSTAPPVDQRAVGAALLTVLNRLAVDSPVIVAIDDLQWLDASSAAAVAFAARRLDCRVGMLCTARSETSSTGWLQLDRPDAVRRIRLQPLAVNELNELLIAKLGSAVPRARMLRIHEVSAGNPFYAVELARELTRRGSDSDLAMPESLNDLVHVRIGRLDVTARDALLAVASLADPSIRAVAHAIDISPRQLVDVLADAESQKIVNVEKTRIRFTHPLLAHASQMNAPPARRRAIHRRLADVVTEPELRARHLAQADPVGEPETLEALDSAADVARARGAPAAAAELLDRAISLGGSTEQRRIRLARCLFDSGEPRRARQLLEAVIADTPLGPQRAGSLLQLAMVRLFDDSFVDAAELMQQAVAESSEDGPLNVRAMISLAFAQLNIGEPDLALKSAERAVARSDSLDDTNLRGGALGMRAIVQFMNGEAFSASDLGEAAAMERPDAAVPVALRPTTQRALLLGWTGQLTAARTALAAIAERCSATGEEGELMLVLVNLVMLDIWLGDFARAAATADDVTACARRLGGDALLFLAYSVQGALAAYQGRVEDARYFLASASTVGKTSGHVVFMTWNTSNEVFLEMSRGDYAGALAAVTPLLPMVHAAPRFTEIVGANFVPDAAEALINLGRHDEAEPLVRALEDNGARLDRAWMLAVGARCRALMCAARGDVRAGAQHARDALEHLDRVAMPFERARTLLVLGRLERRLRQWRSATESLAEALSVFDDLGTPLWAAQVRAELDRRIAGRTRSDGLSPTEHRVATLAASGMNNQEIAAALFVTRKTVEVNLSRIYQKLGIHSRIELYHVFDVDGSATRRELGHNP